MDLESLLVSIYVLVDDWWQENHPDVLRKPGRLTVLSDSEVLTLAILAQWPRFTVLLEMIEPSQFLRSRRGFLREQINELSTIKYEGSVTLNIALEARETFSGLPAFIFWSISRNSSPTASSTGGHGRWSPSYEPCNATLQTRSPTARRSTACSTLP